MSTLTIRLPDDTHARMKALARQRAMSVNKLMEELCTIAVTQHDAETRFRALSARGSPDEGSASSTSWMMHSAAGNDGW